MRTMSYLSILLPQRNAAEKIERQLPDLCAVLDRFGHKYEVLVVDDGSESRAVCALKKLVSLEPGLRVIRLDHPSGTSAALTAGIAAARGDTIVALEPGDAFSPEVIPDLVRHLVRADLVYGRRKRAGLAKSIHRLARTARWALLGLEVRDPGWLCWAARREAVEGLPLARGMYRYLSTLVSLRGFRVSEVPVVPLSSEGPSTDEWPNPVDLLAAWWLRRRLRFPIVREIGDRRAERPQLEIARVNEDDSDVVQRRAA